MNGLQVSDSQPLSVLFGNGSMYNSRIHLERMMQILEFLLFISPLWGHRNIQDSVGGNDEQICVCERCGVSVC